VPNQVDDFEDGTTLGWGSGGPNPTPPVNVSTGGPTGTNDNFLRITSNGGSGAGSKLVVINSEQWKGDYFTTGVTSLNMDLNNFGSTTLSLRIVLFGDGGEVWSKVAYNISPGSGWQNAEFSLLPSDLVGGSNNDSTLRILGNVYTVRIIHSVSGGTRGDAIVAQLGIDNITAITQPVPVELSSFTARVSGSTVKLTWSTASETNNMRFDIQRKYANTNWETIGSENGNGTISQSQFYSFLDEINNLKETEILYRLKQVDFDGSFTYSMVISVDINFALSFNLEQNYPNPFNPSTMIKFSIPSEDNVKLEVFNTLGKKISTVLNGRKEAGSYEVKIDAENWAAGVYFYNITSGNFIATKKMLLIK
jgi:hypothetical protein